MKKYLVIGLMMLAACSAQAQLYSYTTAGSETIDGVTWSYCVSNNQARVINSRTVNTYSDYNTYYYWVSYLRWDYPTSSSYRYSSSSYYYYSAISSSTTGAVAVPSTLGGYPVVAVDHYAFGYCTGLTHITIPEGVKEIGPGAFYHCTGLKTVIIPESIEKIDTCAFDNCTALENVTIPAAVKKIGDYAFRNCTGMSEVTIKSGVEEIDQYAFYGCNKLTRLVVPATVVKINNYAFQGCSKISSIVLSDGLESIGNYAFCSCSALTSFTIPSTVTNIGYNSFQSCSSLKKAVINADVEALPSSMLANCTSLQSVQMPDDIVTIESSCFCGCSSLTDINIPEGLTSIEKSAFQGCSSLVELVLPAGLNKITDYAFDGCTKLIGIDLPVGIQSIGSYAFYNCTSISHVEIPNTVTLVNANAFVGCTGLERITVPGSINTMASGAFNCPNATVIFTGDVPNYSVADSGFLNSKAISYPREYGANWQKTLGTAQFGGYTQTQEELPEVVIVSAQMRPTDSTILDVVYRVNSKDYKVNVRVLAFENGIRSFANIIRPETFVDDTAANVGDNIDANEEHTISWRVSADWQTDLSKMKFEVLAMRKNYIPLELITIPAIEGHAAMTITWNSVSPSQIINALYWMYADKEANFTVSNGVLKNYSTALMNGATLSNSAAAIAYIYSKMGYSVLDGTNLDYAREATRLPLVVDANCPFAVKNN